MIDNKDISSRISILRFVMIFGIVILHTPPYVPVTGTGAGFFDMTKAFFQHGLFRTTVPMLSFISGYLLFKSGLDMHPAKLFRKKIGTLVIPFLVFNLSVLVAAFIAEARFGVELSYNLLSKDASVWLDAAFGVTQSPINYPLNFVRDLVVVMLMAPALGWLLRRAPIYGLILVTLFFYLELDGYLILSWNIVVMVYVGGMAAVLGWNMRALDRFAVPCLALLIVSCVAIVHFKISDKTLLRMAGPLMIWPASSLLVSTAFGAWAGRMSKYSFFIFVAHAPLLIVAELVYGRTGGHIPYPLFWISTPVIVTVVLVWIYKAAISTFPSAFKFMTGAPTTVAQRHKPTPSSSANAEADASLKIGSERQLAHPDDRC
jgi:succinoglycan biosynthesis protein ExoH